MRTASVKGMSKAHEIFFHHAGKPFSGAKIGIEKELRQDGDLTGPIPPVRAMEQDGQSMDMNPISRFPGGTENQSPLGLFNRRGPRQIGRGRTDPQTRQLLIGITDAMNIGNVAKLQSVFIVIATGAIDVRPQRRPSCGGAGTGPVDTKSAAAPTAWTPRHEPPNSDWCWCDGAWVESGSQSKMTATEPA
jgi:hypothetical protein